MDQQRLVELALSSLQKELEANDAERKHITGEIAALRKQVTSKPTTKKKSTRKKSAMSAAQRKKQSEAMKQYWAKRRKAQKK